MNKYKIAKNLFEVIIPTGEGASDDGLFDDCPLCQKMREEIEKGTAEKVVAQWEDDDAN